MTWLTLWLPAVWVICTSVATYLAVSNLIMARRYAKLNMLMFLICYRAFRMQHLPVWRAWADVTGVGFEIRPLHREHR